MACPFHGSSRQGLDLHLDRVQEHITQVPNTEKTEIVQRQMKCFVIYIYIYIYICSVVCIYYIYINMECFVISISLSLSLSLYIYIYIYMRPKSSSCRDANFVVILRVTKTYQQLALPK